MSLATLDHPVATPPRPKGWVTALPLENYSSLHEVSPLEFLGWRTFWPNKRMFLQLCCNLHTPLTLDPSAYLTFDVRDADLPPRSPGCCYSISNFNRWRLDISSYHSIDDYLKKSIRWHRCNYAKSKRVFTNYGCHVTVIEEDWTEYVEEAYHLYAMVAQRHGDWLYDIDFFRASAKHPNYKLLCAWLGNEMIGMFVLQEELPTLHSICCGLDYHHSSASYAYSWMHYVLIEYAIEAQKYQTVDVGLTADDSKKTIGFDAVPSRMDIYSKGFLTRGMLRLISLFVTTSITPAAKVQFKFKS